MCRPRATSGRAGPLCRPLPPLRCCCMPPLPARMPTNRRRLSIPSPCSSSYSPSLNFWNIGLGSYLGRSVAAGLHRYRRTGVEKSSIGFAINFKSRSRRCEKAPWAKLQWPESACVQWAECPDLSKSPDLIGSHCSRFDRWDVGNALVNRSQATSVEPRLNLGTSPSDCDPHPGGRQQRGNCSDGDLELSQGKRETVFV